MLDTIAASDSASNDARRGGAEAAAVARRLLHGLGTRLEHSAAVAAQIHRVSGLLIDPAWRSALEDAAWLHDVGYRPELALTGFHPLDGARWLRDRDWPSTTCRLVAWHTEAYEQARLFGLHDVLIVEFDRPPRLAASALAWADLTSSPTGHRCDPEERFADIFKRYPPGSRAHAATRGALPALRAAVHEIEHRLMDNAERGHGPYPR